MIENNADIKTEESKDTISTLLDSRDCDSRDCDSRDCGSRDSENRDRSKIEESGEANSPGKLQNSDKPSKKSPEKLKEENVDGRRPSANDQTPVDSSEKEKTPSEQASLELEVLKRKLEKTEKTLAENHKYGRSNAQKVRNAVKAVQRFADDGLLAEEEAKELLGTLHSEGEETEEEDATRYQATPFAPIFKVANKEL